MIYLDTHVVVWLYQKDRERFSPVALDLIESRDLLISPMVMLELEYLFETDRISAKAIEIYDNLHDVIMLDTCSKSFTQVAKKAITMKWTRDPFDRLITSQAAIDESMLLTKDSTIHTYYANAVW
ncbi:MAG: PIN domain-containing protein [Spirochaetales bacterium]|nr:PIN domain-containing protein [Spirochaetales bacterium]